MAFIYQFSSNLSAWCDFTPTIEVLDADIDGDGTTELIRAARPVGPGEGAGFLRILFYSP